MREPAPASKQSTWLRALRWVQKRQGRRLQRAQRQWSMLAQPESDVESEHEVEIDAESDCESEIDAESDCESESDSCGDQIEVAGWDSVSEDPRQSSASCAASQPSRRQQQ
jgi:hypothetical protein